MQQRGYNIQIKEDVVLVEHRASLRPRTLILLCAAYVAYCLLPTNRKVLHDFYVSPDPVVACFAIFFLLIPFVSAATWLVFNSGEVFRCDRDELRFARRRVLGRWHRFSFSSRQVRRLRRTFRGGPKSRNYKVLTFDVYDKAFDILEEIETRDAEHILKACKALGLDFELPLADPGAHMLRDIEQRGWWVNPLKSDDQT